MTEMVTIQMPFLTNSKALEPGDELILEKEAPVARRKPDETWRSDVVKEAAKRAKPVQAKQIRKDNEEHMLSLIHI